MGKGEGVQAQADASEIQILFEQVSAVVGAHGAADGQDVAELLAPLLRGEQTIEQNRDMLLRMLQAQES